MFVREKGGGKGGEMEDSASAAPCVSRLVVVLCISTTPVLPVLWEDAAAVLIATVHVRPIQAEAPRCVVCVHLVLFVVMVAQVRVHKELAGQEEVSWHETLARAGMERQVARLHQPQSRCLGK